MFTWFNCDVLRAVMTDWETCNKYQIKNSLGQQVYFAKEGKITCNTGPLYFKQKLFGLVSMH